MKKRVLAVMLASSMAAAALVGCGGSSSGSATQSSADSDAASTGAASDGSYEECTLTFDWWGGDSRHEVTQKAIEAFEAKYPGITISANYGAWSDWETAKASEYLSQTNADIQQINYDWISKYDAAGDTYLDLNTVADTIDLTQYDESTLAICQDVKGGLAGIPVSLTGRTFYWNKATFEAAGLETPTTLEELMAAGPVFAEKLGDNYYPLVVGEYDRMILMTFYLQAQKGTPIIDENGNMTYTEADLQEGLEWIKSLEDAHVIPTEQYILGEGADSMDKSARFIAGEYAGILEWDSAPNKFVSALGENGENFVVGNVFPELQSFDKVSLLFAISAKCEHPYEAALFVNFLVNDPEGVEILGTERGVPESKIAYETLNNAGAIDSLIAQAHTEVMNSNPFYFNPLFDDSSLKGSTSTYTDVFDNFSYGTYDAATAANKLYTAITAVAPAK